MDAPIATPTDARLPVAAARAGAVTPPAGICRDILHDPPAGARVRHTLAALGVILLLVVAAAWLMLILGHALQPLLGLAAIQIVGIAYAIVAILVVVFGSFIGKYQSRRRCARLCAAAQRADLPTALDEYLSAPRNHRLTLVDTELWQALAQAGLHDQTLRIGPARRCGSLQPLTVDFEARVLDEGTASFVEFEQATAEAGTTGSGAAGLEATTARGARFTAARLAQDPTWRGFRRNILLNGGWVVMAVFSVLALLHGWESWQRGRVEPMLLFSLAVLVVSGLPIWALLGGPQVWLVVPGGLLVRGAVWRGGTPRLRRFARRESLLAAIHTGTPQAWSVIVVDGQKTARRFVSPAELKLLLEAWLSPLDPPPTERLTDLA